MISLINHDGIKDYDCCCTNSALQDCYSTYAGHWYTHAQEVSVSSGITSSARDQGEIPCCIAKNQLFYSIVDALSNITSHTIIKLITDIKLLTNVSLVGLENITTLGQGNPTLDCKNVGLL